MAVVSIVDIYLAYKKMNILPSLLIRLLASETALCQACGKPKVRIFLPSLTFSPFHPGSVHHAETFVFQHKSQTPFLIVFS